MHSSVQSNVSWIKWWPFYLSFWQSFLEPVQQNGDMLSPGLSQVPIAVSGLYWIKYAIVMAPWQVAHPLCKCRWKGSGKNKQHQRYSQKILLSLSQKQTSKEKYKRLKKSELFSCCSPVKEMHARVNFCFQSMQSPCQAIWNQCKDFGSIWTLNLVFFL